MKLVGLFFHRPACPAARGCARGAEDAKGKRGRILIINYPLSKAVRGASLLSRLLGLLVVCWGGDLNRQESSSPKE